MKYSWLVPCLLGCAIGSACATKKKPAPPPPAPPAVRSQLPPATAETIEHCVVIQQENANTVTCTCVPASTKIDSKTGHTTLICKKMKEE